MKYISVLELLSEKFINTAHPQEDYFRVSKKYPIFIVADGVTLFQFHLEKKEYPNPSPAAAAARIFCNKALEAAEALYQSFDESDIKTVFRAANEAVGEYNRRHGRTKETVNFWETDLYATTAALAVIKGATVYWGSICDSYVMHFEHNDALRFRSPDCRSKRQAEPPEFSGDPNDVKARTQHSWRVMRNGVNEKDERMGYGVITGEPEALLYISSGNFAVQAGDLVAVLTDGFAEYMNLPKFMALFSKWSDKLESQINKFTTKRADEEPERFGQERTLIMVSV